MIGFWKLQFGLLGKLNVLDVMKIQRQTQLNFSDVSIYSSSYLVCSQLSSKTLKVTL